MGHSLKQEKKLHKYTKPSYRKLAGIMCLFTIFLGVTVFGIYGQSSAARTPTTPSICDTQCHEALSAAYSAHTGLNASSVLLEIVNSSSGANVYHTEMVNLPAFLDKQDVASEIDIFQPATASTLGYGILMLQLQDGIHTVFVGCTNYGQWDESCYKAAITDDSKDLGVQMAVNLVGH